LPVLQSRTPEEHVTWLKNTAQAANQAVFESRQVARNDMGSTLACALLIGTRAYITNLGDSRVYLIREGSLQQITTDHTLVQQMVETGKISPEQVRNHPQRNVIYRSLGEASLVDVEVIEQNLQSGDILLVCSDGLSNMLDAQKIQILIHEASSPQVACDYLVDAANLAGGEDNISVILAEVISA
jgi:protein phosphatase